MENGCLLFIESVCLSFCVCSIYLGTCGETCVGDTCDSGFCETAVLSKSKACVCWVPQLPPATICLGASGMKPFTSARSPLSFWPPVLSSCSTGHSPGLLTCPRWHGYCKVFVLFCFLWQGRLRNNLLARGFFPLLFSLAVFSVYSQFTDWEYGCKLFKWISEYKLLLHGEPLSWRVFDNTLPAHEVTLGRSRIFGKPEKDSQDHHRVTSWSQTKAVHIGTLLFVFLQCLKDFWMSPIFQTLTRDNFFFLLSFSWRKSWILNGAQVACLWTLGNKYVETEAFILKDQSL